MPGNPKELRFSAEARGSLLQGVDAVANAVRVTLGPRGRNVALGRNFGAPVVTNDGVTVARDIELSSRFANMGAQLIKEAASKTNDIAGDGTTHRHRLGAGHDSRRLARNRGRHEPHDPQARYPEGAQGGG